MFRTILALVALAVPAAAHAEWLEASSAHFVVLADDSEADVRRFSEQLERYHAAMAFLTKTVGEEPSLSNRVTVFVVRDEAAVQKLLGVKRSSVVGFYRPRAGRSVAVVPSITARKSGETPFSMIVLLHEYAHHFLISGGNHSLPRWASEGAAEFFSSAAFASDGGVQLGRPAYHRAGEFALSRMVKLRDMLDPETYEKRKQTSYDAFYGKSWLLYHYLTFSPTRRGQMTRYVAALRAGKPAREAAAEAFGDLDKLERELDAYLNQRRINVLNVPASALKLRPIALRKLPPGEAAAMPVRIRSSLGVDEAEAKAVVRDARAVAVRFTGDPAVLSALAEAEYDAGNDEAAIAAADAALALDPGQVNAYVQKGYALFRKAAQAKDTVRAYERARAPFIALNRRENDHPLPLVYYFRSFADQGIKPSAIAVQGLERALELAPFDEDLRTAVAVQQLQDGRTAEARANWLLLASNPHGGAGADAARRVVSRIDSDPSWNGREGLEAVLAPPQVADPSAATTDEGPAAP
jgi:tetratricopeptide (TPR) repeat protein